MHGTPLMFLSIRESAHGGIKIFEGPYLKFRSVSSHLSGVTDNFWTLEIILWNIATPVVVIPLTVHLEFYQCDFGVDGEIKELENWCISIEGVQFSEKKEITAPGVSGARNGGLVLVEKKGKPTVHSLSPSLIYHAVGGRWIPWPICSGQNYTTMTFPSCERPRPSAIWSLNWIKMWFIIFWWKKASHTERSKGGWRRMVHGVIIWEMS